MNPVIEKVTQQIIERSKDTRAAYLAKIEKARQQGPHRGVLSCGNLAHGFAACSKQEKADLTGLTKANIGIVSSYNDMLSAHQPYEAYPAKIKQAAEEVGSVAQFAGGVPAMCDGVTQGQPGGLELDESRRNCNGCGSGAFSEQFDIAYEQMKEASRLAPRNIERNKRLWDLARLNHDKAGQLTAVQSMAKYAKNSIHDSPQLTLNVIRSTIDLATSLGNGEGEKYLKRAESELEELKQQKGMQNQLAEQIDVVRSRVLCLRDEKREAEKLMKDRSASTEGLSMEDSLDKMKAFHELGMREHCVSILDKLRKQIEGDTFTSQVVNEYLNQESIERTEIQFTTKELKQMAAVNYKENRLVPAYNNLRQALTLSPKDKQIALSLLKVITQIHLDNGLSEEQMNSAQCAAKLLCAGELSATQAEKRDQYIARIGIEVDNSNAADLVGMVAVKT